MSEMSLAQRVVDCAKKFDADIVTFGGAERFADTDALEIFPTLRSVICLGFRVLRGSHLGVEEGSTFYQYMTTGLETIEETIMPLALLQVSALLEDAGYTASPQRKHSTVVRRPGQVNPEADYRETYAGIHERMLDMSDVAVRCGAGEMGLAGSVLTEEFGPLVRWCCILTDAQLPETPKKSTGLCDGCGACAAACPGHALDGAGHRDDWQCAAYYRGANREKNPFMPLDAYADLPGREAILDGSAHLTPEEARRVIDETYFYPGAKHFYCACICGRACDMACYGALEARGVLSKQFTRPYRSRPEWKLSPLK